MNGPPIPDVAQFALLPVREVMATAPLSVHVDTTIGELIGLFERHDVEAFPVVTDDGTLRGIVTKLEVLRVMRPDRELRLPHLADVDSQPIARLMRRGVITVEADEPIGVAADLMVETGLRSLPVVRREGARRILAGMVSRGDLVRGLRREMSRDALTPRPR
jgi:CBS domain-containing protein